MALQLFIFCYTLGKGNDGEDSEIISALSTGTVHANVERVAMAIVERMGEEIRWPSERDKEEAKAFFGTNGFRDAIGCRLT